MERMSPIKRENTWCLWYPEKRSKEQFTTRWRKRRTIWSLTVISWKYIIRRSSCLARSSQNKSVLKTFWKCTGVVKMTLRVSRKILINIFSSKKLDRMLLKTATFLMFKETLKQVLVNQKISTQILISQGLELQQWARSMCLTQWEKEVHDKFT